jgi:1-acyl-sn-glycerol-3-phosphate acyltransferase
MKKLLILIYNGWALFWFVLLFLLMFPFVFIFLQRKEWHVYAHRMNYWWGNIFFPIIFMPIKIKYEYTPDKNKAYVFVANHFAYLDIAMVSVITKNFFAFVGKSSVKSIPLFGYMFAKLHIQVDRSDKNSRAKSLIRSMKALQSGRSIFIMPEGGIITQNFPKMHQPFKDGAFTMAVENQVPIVPVSLLNLYELMPEKKLHWGTAHIIVHKPIETKGLTKNDIEDLKKQVYDVIQPNLDEYYEQNLQHRKV